MKKRKTIYLIVCYILAMLIISACQNAGNNLTRSNSFAGYEFFTKNELALFNNKKFQITLEEKTLSLGMSKKDVEKQLGEPGKGCFSGGTYKDGSITRTYNSVTEQGEYEEYKTLSNYYYYPENKVAIEYRCVEDGKKTNEIAVMISVNNSKYTDLEGFMPQISLSDDVENYIIENYGEKYLDKSGGIIRLHFDENGDIIDFNKYIYDNDKPRVWKSYCESKNGICAITVGSKKYYMLDDDVYDLWR